ncbi:MAG TPA: hypothetical protein VFB30_01185 [Spirochaetia bacterium]|nr:hypothetical protein [Spirochaetia bacterium]
MSKKKPGELLPVGRKTVMTPEVVRKLEEAFSMDCTDEEACAYAGVGERRKPRGNQGVYEVTPEITQ